VLKSKLKPDRLPDNQDAATERALLSDEIPEFIERKDELTFSIDVSQFHTLIKSSFDS
jgi:hypothetical protein